MERALIDFELIVTIVPFGQGSKALKIGRKNGVTGGTIFLAHGTVENRLFSLLALDDVEKEIVLMAANENAMPKVMDALDKQLALHKANHGIVFTVSMSDFIRHNRDDIKETVKIKEKTMYSAVFTVTDRGRAEDVVDAAKAAGARGATIINGRGSGIHETSKLFAMAIEPEKEIIMIIVKDEIVQTVTDAISDAVHIEQPGIGVLFTIPVNEVRGLVD